MAIAMQMPQLDECVPYTSSGQDVTQTGSYPQGRTCSLPPLQSVRSDDDLQNAQRIGYMVAELFWSGFSGALSKATTHLSSAADEGMSDQATMLKKARSAMVRSSLIPRLDKAATLSSLERLRTLAPNWSGYGASPINRDVIQLAKEFIWGLPNDIIGTPTVVPMTRGRLQFEWHRGNRSLELELADVNQIHYLKWDSDEGVEEEDVIPVNDMAKVHGLLRWFAAELGDA
jgi:hypothetical protein